MSLVYFASARARKSSESLLEKLSRIVKSSDLPNMISPGDKVFIKCHMGAPLTTRYLRPIFVRRIVDLVSSLGGKPVVVDTTGMGLLDPRGTAEKYLKVAAMHGFTPEVLGAPILIADGEHGLDILRVSSSDSNSKDISLAGALSEADVLIGLAHFKGHSIVGLGGAIKNIAIGLSSKEGKYMFHYENKPSIISERCNLCNECFAICPSNDAIRVIDYTLEIDPSLCIGCLACIAKYNSNAIIARRRDDLSECQRRLAEMAKAVINVVGTQSSFFINFIIEVDWSCDCEHGEQGWSDAPIVPDQGIAASNDPVALDMFSADLVNNAPGIPGTKVEEVNALEPGMDKFRAIFSGIDWKAALYACERLGVGRTDYQIVEID
ncbi:MAG: DUF362 domain-containing protein [Thermoproteota archaeon]